jgi:phosphohistidine phosphatase SixA
MNRRLAAVLSVLPALATAGEGAGPQTSPDILEALRRGDCVLVMRHASSPRETPDRNAAQPDNSRLERQLDVHARTTATAMGDAIVRLRIPIGDVLSSPTYRALETVKLARLPRVEPVEELGDGGRSMQGITDAQATWLRQRARQTPRTGNTVIVTHQPNLTRAFPEWGSTVADGETVVLQPDGKGGTRILGRIPIERWPELR